MEEINASKSSGRTFYQVAGGIQLIQDGQLEAGVPDTLNILICLIPIQVQRYIPASLRVAKWETKQLPAAETALRWERVPMRGRPHGGKSCASLVHPEVPSHCASMRMINCEHSWVTTLQGAHLPQHAAFTNQNCVTNPRRHRENHGHLNMSPTVVTPIQCHLDVTWDKRGWKVLLWL